MGTVCDAEINSLLSELDELIVSSIYKLDMKRPSRSVLRNKMANHDAKKLVKRLMKETISGVFQENIFALIMSLVYGQKGIKLDEMSTEEYDDFLKSSDPKAYKELQTGLEEFMAEINNIAGKESYSKGKEEKEIYKKEKIKNFL